MSDPDPWVDPTNDYRPAPPPSDSYDWLGVGDQAQSLIDRLTARAAIDANGMTPESLAQIIDDVLTVAEAWARGEVPLGQAATLTTPQERFLAYRFVRPTNDALRRLVDAIIDHTQHPRDGWCYRTTGGIFTEAQIRYAGGRTEKRGDDVVIIFPASVPVQVTPTQTAARYVPQD